MSFKRSPLMSMVLVLITLCCGSAFAAVESYKVDTVHSMIFFRVKHANVSYTYGRFNDPAGSFIVDTDNPANSSFKIEVPSENVDTGNISRDKHLKSPDFFNTKQFRTISFESSAVKEGKEGKLEVTGTLSLHGRKKQITVLMEETGRGEMRGTRKIGFETKFTIKRSEFGMTKMMGGVGDEITLMVSLEGDLQKGAAAQKTQQLHLAMKQRQIQDAKSKAPSEKS